MRSFDRRVSILRIKFSAEFRWLLYNIYLIQVLLFFVEVLMYFVLHFIRWDTAGQERFKCIASAYYRGAHGKVGSFAVLGPIYTFPFSYPIVPPHVCNSATRVVKRYCYIRQQIVTRNCPLRVDCIRQGEESYATVALCGLGLRYQNGLKCSLANTVKLMRQSCTQLD